MAEQTSNPETCGSGETVIVQGNDTLLGSADMRWRNR